MIKAWLIHSFALWVTAQFLPGFKVNGFWGALKVSALFGLLNLLLGWLIYGFIGIASLGLGFLFAFVTRAIVNAILLKLTDAFSDSLDIKGFTPAILGALCISAIGSIAELMIHHPGRWGWF
ncbi:MAG TPA: phage holin family protein [Polyangiaceae bacterium]